MAPLLLVLAAPPALSQVFIPDTTPLSAFGIAAGEPLGLLAGRIGELGGRLRCQRSASDRTVSECRAAVTVEGAAVDVWLSAIDSLTGIATFQAGGSPGPLNRWRADLEQRYGPVTPQMQGPQRMMQWVRRGRMIRLTWRRERGGTTVSLSLVDGRVLDRWGRQRAAGP